MRNIPIGPIFDRRLLKIVAALAFVLCGGASNCGGGGSFNSGAGTSPTAATAPVAQNLTTSAVTQIVLQATHEATARNAPATIAVVDRVGNVLAVSQMSGAPTSVTVSGARGVTGGLEAVSVPATTAAVSKAITGAYLSSGGNAFTTRTASQIVQENFNPGVNNQAGGPLFGVQFSQLPCSDFSNHFSSGTGPGPFASPLGLSADPGGLPLYNSDGTLIGGIGVVSKTTYTLDRNIFDVDVDNDEVIALAGQSSFTPPSSITASNITVNGLTLRYTDATSANFATSVQATGSLNLVSVPHFYSSSAGVLAGTQYGTAASGIRPDNGATYSGVNAYIFVDGTNTNRFPPKAGNTPSGSVITASEAQSLVSSALSLAFQTRAQIRIPTNSFAQVTVAVVDLDGTILAMARTPDAAVFGADVAVQKARSAVFFSRTDAAATINALTASTNSASPSFADYITRSKSLVDSTVFADGIAWSERALGLIARPFYPDGINGNSPGSLSLAFSSWSPFTDGLQLDLVRFDIATYGAGGTAAPSAGCGNEGGTGGLPTVTPNNVTRLANGLQIFAGGVPIYRNSTLVGAIGVSGDGIDQDDLVSFLGLQNGPSTLNNAPSGIRADTLSVGGVNLRYVNCPTSPFLNSSTQNAC
ncbi:MAG TPA: heme-binding protein [Alphaproteobacteria bacterium]|nr:heme-binding protein [Alphaproteobacteria bacterium]